MQGYSLVRKDKISVPTAHILYQQKNNVIHCIVIVVSDFVIFI